MSNLSNQMQSVNFAKLPEGYFTIVFPEHSTHRTLRIEKGEGTWEGKLIISKLVGSDNTSDYAGIAHVEASGLLRIWRKASLNPAQEKSLRNSLQRIMGNPDVAGREYALRSGNCYRCNRLLTTPESIERGLGPICADKMGF